MAGTWFLAYLLSAMLLEAFCKEGMFVCAAGVSVLSVHCVAASLLIIRYVALAQVTLLTHDSTRNRSARCLAFTEQAASEAPICYMVKELG